MVIQPQIPASLIRSVEIVKKYLLGGFGGEQQRSMGGKISKVNPFWNDEHFSVFFCPSGLDMHEPNS